MDSIERPYRSISTRWIENLALEEINMEESGVIHFNDHLDPKVKLEESSIELMDDLRELFEIYVTKFNELRVSQKAGSKQIKIFKISNTVNDFILYRNSLKLVFNRKDSDVILIGFMTNTGNYVPARINKVQTTGKEIHEIKAHIGAFNKITWMFEDQAVEIDALVKHYLTEFITQSAQ
jgi:hypothetical protein